MQKRIAVTLLFGIFAGILPILPGVSPFFAVWLACLALLFVGLFEGFRAAMHAGVVAFTVALLFAGGYMACYVALLAVLPSGLLINRLLLHTSDAQGKTVWYPAIRAFTDLTLLPVAFFMAFMLMINSAKNPPVSEMVAGSFPPDLRGLDAPSAEVLRVLFTEYGFVVIASAAWFWVLSLWVLAFFANRKLARKGEALRPDISFTHRGLPFWLPLLLAAFLALATFGQGNDAFTGKTVVFMLLLPYVVSGMAVIHALSRNWHMPVLWLTLIYIILIFQVWTALFVAVAGLYFHIAEMLDKRRKIG